MAATALWRAAAPIVTRVAPMFLTSAAVRTTGEQFDRPDMLVPHVGGHRYGWTHYGVMIPNLPEPHRYFSIMVIAGLPGATAFDVDGAVATSPRDTWTLVATSSSAATSPTSGSRSALVTSPPTFDFGAPARWHGSRARWPTTT